MKFITPLLNYADVQHAKCIHGRRSGTTDLELRSRHYSFLAIIKFPDVYLPEKFWCVSLGTG